MVLDFAKAALIGIPYNKTKIKETLAWLNSMLCDKKREVQTLEDSISWIEKLLEDQK